MFGGDIDWNLVATIGSAIAAAISFVLFALPMLRATEKKERYRAVIEHKRKALYEQTKEEAANRGPTEVSAAESIASAYRVRQLAGNAYDKARELCLQAGYRDPKAPMKYLTSRIVAPVVFALIAIMFLAIAASKDKDVPEAVALLIIMGLSLFGFFLPRILLKNTADKRKHEIQLTFPDALDMMLICVQGGMGIESAINRIGEVISEHSEILAEEIGLLSAELGMLNDRKGAFHGFATRVGSPAAKSFSTAMIQAEQYGTSISKAMRVLAEEQRDQRMALAEQKAASLPPKLTVPMILFFLPALFIVILGPAFLSVPG